MSQMTMNYPSEIARWEDDGGAPIGRFELMAFELMAFVAGGKAKSLPKPAKPTPARAA